jgi:hypothetical protein
MRCSSQFQAAAVKAVDSSRIVLATAISDNHPWLAALKAFPGVTVWEVTKKNRAALVKQVLGVGGSRCILLNLLFTPIEVDFLLWKNQLAHTRKW